MSIREWLKEWFKDLFTIQYEDPVDCDPEHTEILPIRYPKGTEIICPECDKVIATAKRDIMAGESARSEHWESDYILKFKPLRCPHDNTGYSRRTDNGTRIELHTREGWI